MRIKFQYKNHRAEVEERDVDIVAIGFDFNLHPEYHYQPGWMISGWDFSRGRDGSDYRSFYLSNMVITKDDYKATFALLTFPRETPHDHS